MLVHPKGRYPKGDTQRDSIWHQWLVSLPFSMWESWLKGLLSPLPTPTPSEGAVLTVASVAQATECRQSSPLWCSALLSGEGNGSPLQYSCLENSVDRGAWWAAVHGVTQSRT